MYFFYVLQSQKNKKWFYKGATQNVKRRFRQHQEGEVQSTRCHRPFNLVYLEIYVSKKSAFGREKSVKKSGSVWMPLMKRIRSSLEQADTVLNLDVDFF